MLDFANRCREETERASVLKTKFEGIFLGNDVRRKCSVDEEGCKDMFFMIRKHMRFTTEVLQDQGMGSTSTMIKCCVTDAP